MTSTEIRQKEAYPPELEPPRPFGLLRHSLVMAGRSVTKARRSPAGLLHVAFIPIVFLVMFVYLFGGAVEGDVHRYLQFVFPGALVMTVILAGTMMTGTNLNIDINRGVFDRFRSLPIGRSAPLIGSVIGDLLRYGVAIAALFAVGFLMGFRVETGVWQAVEACVVAVVFGSCLSWFYVFVGVVMRDPAGVQGVVTITLFPLAFGTNLVAPTDTMPGWLQTWVKINPATHAIDLCRGLLAGGPVAEPLVWTMGWCVGLVAVFAPLSVWAYRRRTG